MAAWLCASVIPPRPCSGITGSRASGNRTEEIRAPNGVMKVGFDEDGNVDIEAIYWPLEDDDSSMITTGWDQDSNWLIEGVNYEG